MRRQSSLTFERRRTIITITTSVNNEQHNFQDLLDDYENVLPRRGQVVQGKVIELTEDSIVLDIGAKRDAIVSNRELVGLDDTMMADISVGCQLPVYVTNTSNRDDELVVSIEKGLVLKDWERARDYFDNKETLELEVVGYNKGGVLLGFGMLQGFVPNSRIVELTRGLRSDERQLQKAKMVGEKMLVKVIEVDQQRKRLVLSSEAAKSSLRKERLQELQPGQQITGKVSNVVDFGVFVDLGGVNGLIHRSKLSWEPFDHPSEVLQRGDEVEVLIKNVDSENERITLDRRALLPSPWNLFAQEHNPGDILEGTVESILAYGAFVKLTDRITGLVHVSEFLPGSSAVPEKVLKKGEKVLVSIIHIDPEQERVSLSMRRVPQDDLARWILQSDIEPEVEKES